MATRPWRRRWLCSVILTYILIFITGFISQVCSDSLYSADDPLWQLDSKNFNRIVFGKNNAWIIEFYSFWCGHCVRFAPTWKAFAKDIRTWTNIIEVAVVNCAESENVKLCREYDVHSFPTIKLFWTNLDEQDKGSDSLGDRDVMDLRHSVIKFLESEWGSGIPANWPQLDPLQADDLMEIWSKIPERIDTMSIIIEQPESFLGREVILDLSFLRHLIIRRVSVKNRKLVSLLMKNSPTSLFTLLKVERNGRVMVQSRFSRGDNETYVRNTIFMTLAGFPRHNQQENELPEISSKMKESLPRGPYLRDLENSVSYALTREVGVHLNITGEKLDSLKMYLSSLKAYFPGSPTLMSYISKVNKWISHQKEGLTGEDFLKQLKNLRTDKEHLPEIKEWSGCKGSQPHFRGYPCSLWMLFHTLTIQAYTSHAANPRNKDPRKVLFAIHGYIKYFFSCEECSLHFQEMTTDLEENLKNPEDAVLWLWRAHNKVNRRLAGDTSEDPLHKKIQFPPVELCQRCQVGKSSDSADVQWNTDVVLHFLIRFYEQKNIIFSTEGGMTSNGSGIYKNSRSGRFNGLQENEGVISVKSTSYLDNWSFRWFTGMDISLCVSLYFVSVLLLIVIYLLFAQRRRRKTRLMRFVNIYP